MLTVSLWFNESQEPVVVEGEGYRNWLERLCVEMMCMRSVGVDCIALVQ